jgi:5-methylcytosine-specific restriction protein A
VPSGQPCPQCAPELERQSDRRRGTSTERGYGHLHRTRFRTAVLRRDPVCVVCCDDLSTVADHYPKTLRQLKAEGLDPTDPKHGRGLCKRCHDRHTALTSPGGWNAR